MFKIMCRDNFLEVTQFVMTTHKTKFANFNNFFIQSFQCSALVRLHCCLTCAPAGFWIYEIQLQAARFLPRDFSAQGSLGPALSKPDNIGSHDGGDFCVYENKWK